MFGSFFTVVQIKGCKALSHAQKGSIGDSMVSARKNMAKAFLALDWSYMLKQIKGELYFDVGVTIQPSASNDNALVGLWRLDCLEASFGAAGFLMGNLHTINTFSMYGGLQASAPQARKERTHIGYLSAYNLSWEAVRPKDNQRTFFEESHVHQRDPWFHHEVREVKRALEDVYNKSYGVRWEVRVGGQALEEMEEVMDDRVSGLYRY